MKYKKSIVTNPSKIRAAPRLVKHGKGFRVKAIPLWVVLHNGKVKTVERNFQISVMSIVHLSQSPNEISCNICVTVGARTSSRFERTCKRNKLQLLTRFECVKSTLILP